MISLSLTTWIHLGRQTSRIVLGHHLGRELTGPTMHLAEAARIPLTGPPQSCEQCERIMPYAELWRSLTETTFHRRFAQALEIVKAGKPLPITAPD